MPEDIRNCRINLYADDTAITVTGFSRQELEVQMCEKLSEAKQWMDTNVLALNMAKTKAMVFGSRHTLAQLDGISVRHNEAEIELVDKMKYLGIILDPQLKFSEHVSYLKKKLIGRIKMLGKLRPLVGQDITLTLYKSLVLPVLDYCDVVYMTATKEQLGRLQLIQNQSCRIILRAHKRSHIVDMHSSLQLQTLENRRTNHLSALCHKNIYNTEEASLKYIFSRVSENQTRVTRHSCNMNMKIPNIRSTKGRLSIRYRGPKHWNSLSNVLKNIENHDTFKRLVYRLRDQTYDNHPT